MWIDWAIYKLIIQTHTIYIHTSTNIHSQLHIYKHTHHKSVCVCVFARDVLKLYLFLYIFMTDTKFHYCSMATFNEYNTILSDYRAFYVQSPNYFRSFYVWMPQADSCSISENYFEYGGSRLFAKISLHKIVCSTSVFCKQFHYQFFNLWKNV